MANQNQNQKKEGVNEYIFNLANQIKLPYLVNVLKFKAFKEDSENSMSLHRGQKAMKITYNTGTDLYDIVETQFNSINKVMNGADRIKKEEKFEGLDWEQLRSSIESHFNKSIYFLDQFMRA